MAKHQLIFGDSVEELKKLPDQSIDSVVSDPPYPEIQRAYGRMTEGAWAEMMDHLIVQIRRVLTPKGSAVFILQPNHETPGRLRPWLFKFMAKYCEEWNMPQDAWWWNWTACPTTHCSRKYGLMRPSVKACVWLGPVDCYRNQDTILWESTFINAKASSLEDRALKKYPSGSSMRRGRCIQASLDRGGSTPFNLLPVQAGSLKRKGSKHGASTPLQLCEYWVNYLTPKGGTVLDPFSGVATVGVAALKHGFDYIGIEKYKEYHDEAGLVIEDFFQKSESMFDEVCND